MTMTKTRAGAAFVVVEAPGLQAARPSTAHASAAAAFTRRVLSLVGLDQARELVELRQRRRAPFGRHVPDAAFDADLGRAFDVRGRVARIERDRDVTAAGLLLHLPQLRDALQGGAAIRDPPVGVGD